MTDNDLLSLALTFRVPGRDYVKVHLIEGTWRLVSHHHWIRSRFPLLSVEGSLKFVDAKQAVTAALSLPTNPDELGVEKMVHCTAPDCPWPTSVLGHDTCGYGPQRVLRETLFECCSCPTTARVQQETGTEGPEGWSAVPGSNGRLCCAVCCSDPVVRAEIAEAYEI